MAQTEDFEFKGEEEEDPSTICNNCASVIFSKEDIRECRFCKKRLCISCKELQTKIEFMINGPVMEDCHPCKVLADITNSSRPKIVQNEEQKETAFYESTQRELENASYTTSKEEISVEETILDTKEDNDTASSQTDNTSEERDDYPSLGLDNKSDNIKPLLDPHYNKPLSDRENKGMDKMTIDSEKITPVISNKTSTNKSFYSKMKKRRNSSNNKTEDDGKTREHPKTTKAPTQGNNKDSKDKIRFTRQESARSFKGRKKKVSKHVCAGCGRRDCEGQFMKLLREMIETAKRKKFEIRNVVPDGNCMFAAVVDQLELTGCHGMFSAISLRQEAVNYLRAHPESEDGTHYTMFMDGEEWEEYLTRMSREGQWGDHLILKALSKVTERDIKVLSGNENRGFTDIKCGTDQSDIEPLVLGHVGELHYVSLRPASAEELSKDDDDEIEEEELMVSLTPHHIGNKLQIE